ncbi:ABC transporter substrate-binding protein [Roseomonas xinghualingensis]|uniref:ABC transporter substrate-binding protein n=1 Tax=Roseomonas xinghualingensis TaxID=2986475 RepID=UPI0021F1F7D3|nr:extracellular solute-binding protein [Roseomonas sp. SXEYE001]MCV4208873.1 extracellular solute-binding protein [Roseomonas sp. SXEYE001]
MRITQPVLGRRALGALAAASVAGAARAQGVSGKVTVVTSFSNDVTGPFKRAFEAAHPGTTLDIQNRNTTAGVRFVQETRSNNAVDLFWASAPDAFEVLKRAGLLEVYKPQAEGIPERIGPYSINDPEGYVTGFAASGYGIMWNERYMRANRLPEPKEWSDLAKPAYHDHVIITAPSRSGTTHLTIETILQGEGWEKGWGTIKGFSGNLRQITERSFGVPDAVNSGQVGIGIVIDFFAFSAQGAGFPVKFAYPSVTTVVPANIAIVKNAPNTAGARAFIDFLLSQKGQEILLEPTIRRLPVNPSVYAKAPQGYPNPFTGSIGLPSLVFDVGVSEKRYRVVDALYDQTVGTNLEGLKRAAKAIGDVETRLARRDNAQARALLEEARALISAMPVTAEEAASDEVAGAFSGRSGPGPRQAELEQRWAGFAREKYTAAAAKAAEAAKAAG